VNTTKEIDDEPESLSAIRIRTIADEKLFCFCKEDRNYTLCL